jgi:diadenosine tetraphosphate (Ap4A) HIT family hydrolase
MPFVLDPSLAGDTLFVSALPTCDLLLLNDARYPWAVLVPRVNGVSELHELAPAQSAQVIDEVLQVGRAVGDYAGVEKVNVGALGNIVRQLHIHVVGRSTRDPAWPGPVWGHSPRVPYQSGEDQPLVAHLKLALGHLISGRA